MKATYTIILLILSNTFMTLAWYGHLKFKEMSWSQNLGLVSIILISWGIALFEYILQVPANRIGFRENGGPFSLVELKVIQEVITLTVFVIFSVLFFKNETIRLNHIIGFIFLVLAVYFIFKK
jgi:uncharacterized protein (DUF486 family)